MIVIDASVMINMLTHDGERGRDARKATMADPQWLAPAHLPIEVASGVRSLLLKGKISTDRANDAIAVLAHLEVELIDTRTLLARTWELRGNLTSYDGAYVALAEAEQCPLLTADAKLAGAPGIRCQVHVL